MGPDLVHTTSLKASVYGTIAARAVRLPLLWHLHDRLAADYLPPAVVPPMRLFAATARARPSRRLDSPYESSAKGQHVFLEAFATAFPEGSLRARLIGSATFGEADYGRALREQAERLGIADRVDFVGFNPDVLGELERADLLVHASVLSDPLNTSVLEGIGAGVPVVATDTGLTWST